MSYPVNNNADTQIPEAGSIFRTLGDDPIEGELGCGFIVKQYPHDHGRRVVFKKYGALLLIQGSGRYRDEQGTDIPIGPGSFVQRIPDLPHYTPVATGAPWVECFVTFGTGLYKSLANLGCLDPGRPVQHPGLSRALISRFRDIRTRLREAQPHELPRILLEIQALLFQIMDMDRQNDQPPWKLIDDARRLLEKDLAARCHVEDLVRDLGVGYESFRKLFRQNTGLSPNEYRIRCRIDVARTLLMQPALAVKEIALELGYPDTFTFSRQFKRVTGLSPSEFRHLH